MSHYPNPPNQGDDKSSTRFPASREESTRARTPSIIDRVEDAAKRDAEAERRDVLAAARDRTADLRDRASDDHELLLERGIGYPAKARAAAADDRARSSKDRARSADDRKHSAAYRAHALDEVKRADVTARRSAEELARVVVANGDNG